MKKIITILAIVLYSSTLFAQDPMIGEIRLFAGNFAPRGWAFCNGTMYNISENETLYSIIGTTYGGDGMNIFAVPDLRTKLAVGMGRGPILSNYTLGQTGGNATVTIGTNNLPLHTHTASVNTSTAAGDMDSPAGGLPTSISATDYNTTSNAEMGANSLSIQLVNAGTGQAQNNVQPYLGINYIIAMQGMYNATYDQYMGEVKLTASNQIPNGWLPCDGRLIAINTNQALYSLLGTTYGGNGSTNFALPDMRGRVPVSRSSTYALGSIGGTESETLTAVQMALHSHTGTATMGVYSGVGNSSTPVNNYPAVNPQRGLEYTSTITPTAVTNTVTTDANGSGQAIDNRQPYATIQYIIATTGLYPSRP